MTEQKEFPFQDVYGEIAYVQKDGQMSGAAHYKYASEAAFIGALRPAMVAHGITIHPTGYEVVFHEMFETVNAQGVKKMQNRVVVLGTFEARSRSGEVWFIQALGEGIDPGDKATYKAMTGALKYALRQAFLIETGDDPDGTDSGEQERVPVATVPVQKTVAAPPPAPEAAASPAAPSGSWPEGYAEQDDEGQWWIQCGFCKKTTKARRWDTNDRGPSNVSCTSKKGQQWCKFRRTMGEIDALYSAVHGRSPTWISALQVALTAAGLEKDDLSLLPINSYGVKALRDYMATSLGHDDPSTGVAALVEQLAELKASHPDNNEVDPEVAQMLMEE